MSKITLMTADTDIEYELVIVLDEFTYRIKPHVFPNMVKGGYLERIGVLSYALTAKAIEKGYTVRQRKDALETALTDNAPTPLDALKTAQGAFSDSIDAVRGTIRQLLVAIIRAELLANTSDWVHGISFNFDDSQGSIEIEAREHNGNERRYGLVKYLEPETSAFLFKHLHMLAKYGCISIRLDEVFDGYVTNP